MSAFSTPVRFVTVALLLLGATGISCRVRTQPVTPLESNLKSLAVLYGQYISSHQGKIPSDADTFRTFLAKLNPAVLTAMKVNSVDELFVSPRDGKPYVVRYALNATTSATSVVAYEQDGVRGKRYVAFSVGRVEEVDQTKFDELVPQP